MIDELNDKIAWRPYKTNKSVFTFSYVVSNITALSDIQTEGPCSEDNIESEFMVTIDGENRKFSFSKKEKAIESYNDLVKKINLLWS